MLAKLLGVRPEDRRDTAVAFFTLVAILSAHSMLETARDALFLDKLPAERLPIAYLAIAVLALGVSRLNQAATARFARRKLLSLSLLVGGAITAGFHPVLASPATFSLEALYVWTGLLATVVVVQFWLQLGDVLDVVQAKRVFAIIGAGGLVGATLGSAGAGALLALFGDARSLLPVSGALFAVAAFVPIGFSTKSASEPARRRRGDSKRHRGLRILKGDAYLKRLFAMVLVAALLVTGVDYLFKAEVAAQAKLHGWDLGRFFALYYAIVNAVALLVQLLIAPRLLRAVGVNRALLVLPALMLFGAIGFTLTLGLIPALLLKGADGSMRHSIYKTSSEILYLPLSKTIRERFKAMAEALGQRGGQALASLIILAATAIDADARHVGWALVVLAGAWVASLFGLQPHYLERFKRQLRQGSLDTEIDVPELDLASFETLVAALSAADDAEVIAALGMFEAYGKTDLVPALILYHPSPQVVQHAFAMFAQTKRADVRRLTGRLLSHEDPEIRAEALRVSTHHEPNEEQLRGFLVDDSPVVRTGALVGLIRAGFADEQEATNKLRAILSGECRFSREALAKSIPELAESHTWVGIELAERGDTSLTAQVARAMAKAPHVDYLPVLMKMLASRDARANAREALLNLDHAALDHLAEQLANVDLPRNIRLHLPRTVSRFSDQRAAAILLDALEREQDDAVRHKIMRGLGRMCTRDPSLELDRRRVLDEAQSALEHAAKSVHWRLAVQAVLTHRFDQPEQAQAGELLIAYLHDRESSTIERLFRLLHILDPSQEFHMIYTGLTGTDSKARASSLELLSVVVPQPLRDGILHLVDDVDDVERLEHLAEIYDPPGRAVMAPLLAQLQQGLLDGAGITELEERYVALLRDMLHQPSAALRSIVAYHVGELGLDGLREEVAEVCQGTTSTFRSVANRALELLDVAPPSSPLIGPELSGAS